MDRQPREAKQRSSEPAEQYGAGFLASPAPLYYEWFRPQRPIRDPLVLVHGGAHTGACYRATPDGRPGWANDFLQQGFEVVLPDWPGSGRSGHVPYDRLSGSLVVASLAALVEQLGRPATVLVHSMSGPYGWKLLEVAGRWVPRLVAVAPGPPGNLQPEATLLAEDDDVVELERFGVRWRLDKHKGFRFEESAGRAKLIGGSTRFPVEAAESYLATLQPLAPRLIYERQNVRGSQLRLADDVDLRGARVLVVTGSADTDHPRKEDEATASWIAERGAQTDFVWLADRGIVGNGHMLMLEENSAEIATLIGRWIRTAGG